LPPTEQDLTKLLLE
nr:Chain B, Signal Transducer And Activator Of Transcription 6 [Homo sapiens]